MNGHAKMGLVTYSQEVSRGAGRAPRKAPTARITCICRWGATRHARTYDDAKRLAEIALAWHVEDMELGLADPAPERDLAQLAEILTLSVEKSAVDVESEEL